MLNSHAEDDCCKIGDALLSGELDEATIWACPKCGLEWKPTEITDGKLLKTPSDNPLYNDLKPRTVIRHWEPHPVVAVFGVR
jgi:hypothetical protein